MYIEIDYGKQTIPLNIPKKNLQEILTPKQIEYSLTGTDEVARSLNNPIGTGKLRDIVKSRKNVCIVTSDITRPMPSMQVLPLILDELKAGGIEYENITIVLALGNHRTHTEDEKKKLLGEYIFEHVRCLDSNQNRVVRMGITSRGTPVDIFDVVANADFVICLGNIEYHYFAGYSGGAKAIMPGVSTAEAIRNNHSMMIEKTSVAGRIKDNNVRLDIEEVAKFRSIDFILNVILDEKKQIIHAVSGEHIKAHRYGCDLLDRIYKVKIKEKADIVLVSAGGYPKDINLYQAQKALDNAKHAVKDGGIVILVSSCNEGMGEKVFENWMLDAKSPSKLIERIDQCFELGGHKAAAIALVLQYADIYLVSEMDEDSVINMFMLPFESAQEALDCAIKNTGENAKVIVMPYGASTLPIEEGDAK